MKSLNSMTKIEDYRVGRVVNGNRVFQAASISKVVCAMIALRLVEKGKIKLDGDVNDYLKDWKVRDGRGNEKKVSLKQLLSHTSGVNVSGFFGYSSNKKIPSLIQILNGIKPANSDKVFVKYGLGKYRYSGGGYLVVQKLIEDITGKKFEDIAKKYVFDKLGMKHSDFKFRKSNGNKMPEKAAAGLWSCANDLAKLIIEIQLSYVGKSNRILSKKMVRKMLKPVVKAEKGYIGLGVFLTKDKKGFFHKGHNYRFRSKVYGDLGGSGYVVMVNSDGEKEMNGLIERANIDVEIKKLKDFSKTEKDLINKTRVREFGKAEMKDFKRDYEPDTLWFFVKDNKNVVAFGGLRPIKINYLGKKYNILGICSTISIKKGRGYGRTLVEAMIDYFKKKGKTGLGFTGKTKFFKKVGLGTKKDFVKRFVYRDPKTSEEVVDEDGDGIYYDGKDGFIRKVLSTKGIVYIEVLHW